MSGFYPAVLRLQGRCCLVVGGGSVAARKAAGLIGSGAQVRLVSPELTEELEREVQRGKITHIKRGFKKVDLEGVYLAVCAIDNRELNREIAEYCDALHIPVNVADNPELSSFFVPAMIKRGHLCISIATGGNSPLFSRRLREQLEEQIGPEYGELVALLGQLRRLIQEQVDDPDRRRKIMEEVLPPGSLNNLDGEKMERIKKQVKKCSSSPLE